MALIETGNIEEKFVESSFIHQSRLQDDFVVCKSPGKLLLLIEKLNEIKNIHFVSNGDWSMHDLVIELIKKYGPADLYFTTYALREFAVRQIINAIELKQIKSVTLILDYKAKSRTPEVYQLASMNFSKIFLASIHAKVAVLKCANHFISIIGSANWTNNPRIEAGVISMEKPTMDFHIDWINKTIEHAEIFE
ncbi:hypothetical protein [Paracoccus sp. (in: a-proteobacteria)]|uniref:hypothetical protein n=1 Tax=Paracoccus sp. TaxID=267 RepID=UPI00322068DA